MKTTYLHSFFRKQRKETDYVERIRQKKLDHLRLNNLHIYSYEWIVCLNLVIIASEIIIINKKHTINTNYLN